MKEKKVKIREAINKDGTKTIYLDCFMGYYIDFDGKKKANRVRRYLEYRLIQNPRNPIDKQHNKDCMQKSIMIANRWENSLLNEEYGLEDTEKTKSLVHVYLEKEIERIEEKSTKAGAKTMLGHFKKFFPKNTTFRQINRREKAKGFYDYLTKEAIKQDGDNLSTKSANKYFKRLRYILKESKLEGYIDELRFDVKLRPDGITEKVYLTLDEFRILENTEEKNTTLKNAFLFACLTALRFGDLSDLTWGEIKEENGKIRYDRIMDKKPNGKERRISNYFDTYAKKFIGKRQGDSDKVFPLLPPEATRKFNDKLHSWIIRAGINKHITFHCAKHSFAMYHIIHKEVTPFQLASLLNHTDIRTSMHYYDLCSPELKEKLLK